MADDVIFVRRGEELVSLAVAPYEAEAVLQGLLEHYPQLLAGYGMSRRDPRRFLLVCREAPVADQYGAARWSLDHLFVDQDAIPTLVEVKRSCLPATLNLAPGVPDRPHCTEPAGVGGRRHAE